MKKYTLTTVDRLNIGDTFLKENDVNEVVYTKLGLKNPAPKKFYVRKGELKWPDIMKDNEPIIFLNHGSD